MSQLSHVDTLADLTRARAEDLPDATALLFGERRTTFAELNSLTNQVGNALCAAALVPVTGGAGLVLVLGAVNGGWAWVAEAMSGPARKALPGAAALACLTLALAQPWLAPRPEQEGLESFTALLVPGNFSVTSLTCARAWS